MEESVDELFNEYLKLTRQRRWDEALTVLEKSRELDPRHHIIHQALINIYSLRGKIDSIVNEYLRYIEALSLREEFDKVKSIIPRLLLLTREREKTIKRLINLFKKDRLINEFFRMTLLLVRVYFQQGKWDQAAEILKKIYRNRPENFEIRMEMATLFNYVQMPQVALMILRETLLECIRRKRSDLIDQSTPFIRRFTGDDFMVHLLMAETFHQALQLEKAAEHYAQAIKLERNNTRALVGIANVLLLEYKFDLAIRAYQKVLAIESEEPVALKGIARAFVQVGDNKPAIDHLVKLSRIYIRSGKFSNGYAILKKILSLDQENQIARAELEKLEKRGISTDEASEKKLLQPSLMKPAGPPVEGDAARKSPAQGKKSGRRVEGKKHPPRGFYSHKMSPAEDNVKWRDLEDGESDFSSVIDGDEEAESPDRPPEGEPGETEMATAAADEDDEIVCREGIDELDLSSFLPEDMVVGFSHNGPVGELVDEELPDIELIDMLMFEIPDEDLRTSPPLIPPDSKLKEETGMDEDNAGVSGDIPEKPPAPSSIVSSVGDALPGRDTGQRAIQPTPSLRDDPKGLSEEAQKVLDKMAATIFFVENDFFLGIINLEGHLLWRSKKSLDKAWAATITSLHTILVSIQEQSFFSGEKRLSQWIMEFESSACFICHTAPGNYLFLIVPSTERVETWHEKITETRAQLGKALTV